MAVVSQPWLLLYLFLAIIPFSSCQPQNIETFYPFDVLSPAPAPSIINNPPTLPPLTPTTSPQILPPPRPPPPPESSSSNRKTIVKAVAATAASTLVVALLFFFGLQKYFIARRKRDRVAADRNSNENRPVVLPPNEFTRFDGNVKGLIVDENGLDVLYWRKLEEGDKNKDFQKEVLRSPRHDEEKEEMVIYKSEPIQEVPLLRGKSSSSHINIQPEDDDLDQIRTSRPPSGSVVLRTIEEKEPAIHQSTAPPRPSPAMTPMASPPPPPPPTPPIQSRKSPPPPPSPPIPAKKSPAPPPPPPKAGGSATSLKPPPGTRRSSSDGQEGEFSAVAGSRNGQVKLRPLHWDKVNKNVDHSMVWDKIDNGSFRFDGDLMEALFGYVATNRKSPTGNSNSKNPTSPTSNVIILDARKSQNTAIVLKTLALSRRELLDALLEGKELNAEALEKLTRIAPTKEEESKILAFDGDPTRLADAESFHYHILKAVPSAYTRLNALQFRSNYDSEIIQFKESIQTLESGCKELRTRGLLLKLLEAILKAGNRMNAGTARGNAQAFNLTALRKLSDVKSMDGKTTLLHFVVQEVVRAEGKRCVINRNHSLNRSSSRSSTSSITSENSTSKDDIEKEYTMLGLPVIGGISSEFSNVKKAASIDYDTFAGTCSALSARAGEIRELVFQCDADGGGFVKKMKGFLEAAEKELKVLREEQTKVVELVKKTTEYFQAKQQRSHPLQLFVIIKDFLGMVDNVCVEIARNMQRRKTSSPRSPPLRTVRFPNLPEHFLTDKSRSNSSGSDSD